MSNEIVEVPERKRFELAVEGEIAVVDYDVVGDLVILTHTEVPSALSGQGIGSRLANAVFDNLRSTGRRAVVRCEFMANWVDRHPEVRDIVEG